MKILHKPAATAGQIVKDLELVVAKNPDVLLDYSSDSDLFVEGVKLRKDIAMLEITDKEERAATAEDLLSMFRMLNASVGVVLQDSWELLNFVPFNDGRIIRYDEEDGYCLFGLDNDVRLVTTQQIEAEVKKIGDEGLPGYEVVPIMHHGNGLRAYRANCLRECYGKLCLCYIKDEEKESITVGELLKEFPYCAEFMVRINGDFYTVDVDKNGIFCSVAKSGGKPFFAIHVGEMVLDPWRFQELL